MGGNFTTITAEPGGVDSGATLFRPPGRQGADNLASVPEASNDITAFDAALREQPWCLGVEQATLTPTEGDTGLNFRGKVILVDPSKLFSSRAN